MTEERVGYAVQTKPDVAAEIERLFGRLEPELRTLLSGTEKFRIEIHGKPGGKCTYSVTRIVE